MHLYVSYLPEVTWKLGGPSFREGTGCSYSYLDHELFAKTWAHMEPASSQVHLQLAVCPPARLIPL